MKFEVWWIWMAFAAIFIIGEIFTAGFFLLWFGIGAAVAGILALFGSGMGWQWGAFVVITAVLFSLSKKFADRFTKKQPAGIGADRFVGKNGVVLETIDNSRNSGRVRIEREEWRANSDTDDVIPAGKKVKVKQVVGTHLLVAMIEEGD